MELKKYWSNWRDLM